MIITIDGPMASGKSTVARLLAQKTGFYYIYSGLFYRALAYLLIKEGRYTVDMVTNPDHSMIVELLSPDQFVYQYTQETGERIYFQGIDITAHLKSVTIDTYSSLLSMDVVTRTLVNRYIEKIVRSHDVIVDGRDAGSVMFPQAECKIYLVADPSVRALRWQRMQSLQGKFFSDNEALALVNERDSRDTNRTIAPLIIPDNAYVIDDSAMTPDQVCDAIMAHVELCKFETMKKS